MKFKRRHGLSIVNDSVAKSSIPVRPPLYPPEVAIRDRVRAQEYLKRLPAVSVSRIVDHIDHIVKLVGIDHVGIGSDFDGVQVVPADLKSVADLPNLTKELLKRGYSESDIDKILGGNMLRVMEEVARR